MRPLLLLAALLTLFAPLEAQDLEGLVLDIPSPGTARPVPGQEVLLLCSSPDVLRAVDSARVALLIIGREGDRVSRDLELAIQQQGFDFADAYRRAIHSRFVLGRLARLHWQQFEDAALTRTRTDEHGYFAFDSIPRGDYIAAARIQSPGRAAAFAYQQVPIGHVGTVANLSSHPGFSPADSLGLTEIERTIVRLEVHARRTGIAPERLEEIRREAEASAEPLPVPAEITASLVCGRP